MRRTPTPFDEALIKLIKEASGGTISLRGDALEDIPASVTLRPDPEAARKGDKVVMLFALQHVDAQGKPTGVPVDPHEGMEVIQKALGDVPAFEAFNKLQPLPSFEQHVAALAERFGDSEEVQALQAWQGTKAHARHEYGAHLKSASDGPLLMEFSFADKNDALAAKANLDARLEAIRGQFIAGAMQSEYLTAEQKQQLAQQDPSQPQLKLVTEEREIAPGKFKVLLRMGMSDGKAGPDGQIELKASPLNALTENPTKIEGGTVASSWDANLRHWAVFAGDKTNERKTGWQEGLPLLAGNDEMQRYISSRSTAEGLNPDLQAALKGELMEMKFTPGRVLDMLDRLAKPDFKLSPPDERHPATHRLRVTVPEGMTEQDIIASVIGTAQSIAKPSIEKQPPPQEQPTPQPANDNPAGKPVIGPQTEAVMRGATEAAQVPVVGNMTEMLARQQANANGMQAGGKSA